MATYRLKRWLDLSLCIVAAPFVLLAIAACAVLVRLESRGPIFFSQHRTGRGSRRFRMYKLRTMCVQAETLKADLTQMNHQSGPDFKIRDDPRITKVGRILRKYSLDELPQIWNVICGDMSLVGPRPTSFSAETYATWQTERLEARPGLTGLWQIGDRSDIQFDDRVRLDIAYVRNCSLFLDLKILLRTVRVVIFPRGAY
jgi:lipopolysaccharide/colanic/teichoic acid biosynthesis glycosyltransferase